MKHPLPPIAWQPPRRRSPVPIWAVPAIVAVLGLGWAALLGLAGALVGLAR